MKREYDLEGLARRYGFNVREVEKVCRISDLLEDVSAVRFLRDRLSLYGRTALTFIHSEEIRRLSIDLDLNYRHLDERDWGEVRSEIEERVKDLLYRQVYERSDIAISPTYPLARITVHYRTLHDLRGSFRIEVGYMRRYPILKDDMLADFRHIGTQQAFQVKTPRREELFANKLCVLLYRGTPRDLFDVYQISKMEMEPVVLRKCTIVDSLMRGRPKLYEIDVDRLIEGIPIDSGLRNLLQTGEALRLDLSEMRREVLRFSKSATAALTRDEVRAIDHFFDSKRFEPEFIDEEGVFNERLKEHPSILWALSNLT